jgi:TetR/AcrR family transcriptional regulator, transcriptional repressor for nem operon
MPRVSKQQSDQNRVAITEVSGRLFRERGLDGVSVADLMAAVGLTHGGFYGHFESKDALAAEACSRAFAVSAQRWEKRVSEARDNGDARAAIIENFLSTKSRNTPGQACPTAALAVDVGRQNIEAPIRAAFAEGLEDLLRILQTLQPSGGASEARRKALADLATLVGAQILARATSQGGLSEEILSAARARLHDRQAVR